MTDLTPDDALQRIRDTDADVLVWLDVETTGLVAHKEHLLEVAAIVTDTELNVLIEEPFHEVVYAPPFVVAGMRARANDYVAKMHEETGLWDRLSSGEAMDLRDVDRTLRVYVQHAAPIPRQARVAGSSVRLDLNFAEEHLSTTYHHLHYRSIDVTALWSAIRYAGHEDLPTDRELADLLEQRGIAGQAHEPLYDLAMSMQRYRVIQGRMQRAGR